MATENDLIDAKYSAWSVLAKFLVTLTRIAEKLETALDRELADRGKGGRP